MKDMLERIKERRSTRRYLPAPLPDAVLERVLEAGRYAPSGNNFQTTHFIAITSPQKMAQLREVVTALLAKTPLQPQMPPPLQGLIKQAQAGTVDVNYGAPVLVLVANKKGYANAMADCSCALMNMMLAAADEELGSCWINQYRLLGEAPPLRAFLEKLGLQEEEEIYGALALGTAEKLETQPLPRTGNPVTYVR